MTKITQWERACTHHVGVDGLVVPGGPQLPSEGAEVPALIFSSPGDQGCGPATASSWAPSPHLSLSSFPSFLLCGQLPPSHALSNTDQPTEQGRFTASADFLFALSRTFS